MIGRRWAIGVVVALAGVLVQAAPATAAKASQSVAISASATSVPTGQVVTLTATASRSVSGTGVYLEVFDQTGGTVLAACASGTVCTTTVSQAVAMTRSYRAQTARGSDGSGVSTQSAPVSVAWVAPAPSGDPVVVAAGDIACDPADANFSGANTSTCQMAATANEIAQLKPAYLLPLGDTQYALNVVQGQAPTLSQYTDGYGTSWGKLPTSVSGLVVRPTPGNHEWGDANESQAQPLNASTYFQYFGSTLPAGVTATNDWYSFDIPVTNGSWHVVSLDSECGAIGGCGAGSPEETWLRNDLQAHANQCIAAYWHEPRWSAGASGNDARYGQFWQDLYAAHTAIVLNGHDHDYEHFTPQSPTGASDPAGISEFVVGTGGVGLEWFNTTAPNTKFRDNTTFGALKMTMHAGSVDYAYRTIAGAVPDSGTITCPTASTPPPPGAPVVTGVSPVSGPSAGGTVVSVSGSNLSGATAVRFGSVAATSFSVGSSTAITATAPAGSTTVDVTVTTPSGTSATGVADEFTYTFANGGYAVQLASTSTAPAVGSSVTLTATANQDMTSTPFGISIMDATTGVEIAHTGSGTTLSLAVSKSVATTHRYVGLIANSGGANPQASSAPVIISWT